jgi:hypothetical protein
MPVTQAPAVLRERLEGLRRARRTLEAFTYDRFDRDISRALDALLQAEEHLEEVIAETREAGTE